MERAIKQCSKCDYDLRETVKEQAPTCVVGKCKCPQCGSDEAVHFMYVDERNIQGVGDANT